MTTTHPDPETTRRLEEFVARCRQRTHKAPLPAPPQDAPPPPQHWQDETEPEDA